MAWVSRTATLLMADVRFASDMTGHTARLTDAQLIDLINLSLSDVRRLVSANGNPAFAVVTDQAIAAGASSITITDTWGAVLGVDVLVGSDWRTLRPYALAERADYPDAGDPVAYQVRGNTIHVIPTPSAATTLRVYTHGEGTAITAGTDTISLPPGCVQWVIYDVAMRVLSREDDPERLASVRELWQRADQALRRDIAGRLVREPSRRVDTRRRARG